MIKILPIFLLLLAGTNYGLIFPINSMAIKQNLSYFGHAFWQTGISGLILLLIATALGKPLSISRDLLKLYFLVGVFAFSIPMSLLSLISLKLPVGMTSLVMGLSPAFTYILGVVLRIESLSIYGTFGVSLGFTGLLFLVLPELYLPSSAILPWFCLALITPLCLAIANVSASIYQPKELSALTLGAGYLLAAATTTLPLAAFNSQLYWPLDNAVVIPTLIASIINVFHIVLFATIIKRYGPVFFSQFNYVVVACAMFWAFVLNNEMPSFSVILPLIFISFGVLISSVRPKNL